MVPGKEQVEGAHRAGAEGVTVHRPADRTAYVGGVQLVPQERV